MKGKGAPGTFVFVGTKLKASAAEPEFYVLFQRPVRDADRERVAGALPVAVTASLVWSGRLLVFGSDAAFQAALRDSMGLGGRAAFDAALEAWVMATHAEHPIASVVSIDGKGSNVAPKRLAEEIVARALGPLMHHFDEAPSDTRGSWLLYQLIEAATRSTKTLDEPTFAALAGAVERGVDHCDGRSVLYLLDAHEALVERAPRGAAERLAHRPSFRLAKQLKAYRHDQEFIARVRELAREVDDAGGLLVARVAAWLLGGGPGLDTQGRIAVAEALLEGEAIRGRPADGVSVGDTLAGAAAALLLPFGRAPTTEEIAQAEHVCSIAERYADAQPGVAAATAQLRAGHLEAALKPLLGRG